MKALAKTFLIVMIGLSAATVATSQTLNRNGPPVDQIAADLGVSTTAFESCTSDARQPQGERPSREEHEARLNTLAGCLQQSNASVTAEMVGEVMEKYRPAPPSRG
jgi:hypothetical protein